MTRRPNLFPSSISKRSSALAVLVLAVGITGCGSSSKAASPSTSTSSSSTSTSVAAAAATTTTSAPSTSRCHTSQLSATFADIGRASLGNHAGFITLKNVSTQTCTVTGYPGLGFLDAGNNVLNRKVVRGGSQITRDGGSKTLTLVPNAVAYAGVGWNTSDTGDTASTCVESTSLQITPPDETDHLTTPGVVGRCPSLDIQVTALSLQKLTN